MLLQSAVYRFFNSAGELLYVGCTAHFSHRMLVHAGTARFEDISQIKIAWFPTRREAARAEKEAIKAELPKWNEHHAEPDNLCSKCGQPKTKTYMQYGVPTLYCGPCRKKYAKNYYRGVTKKKHLDTLTDPV